MDLNELPLINSNRFFNSPIPFNPASEADNNFMRTLSFSEESPVSFRKGCRPDIALSDNPLLLGRPSGFKVAVKEVSLSNGAGFIVVLTGNIMTMPGLPKVPAAEKMDILEDGTIIGLF